jgi:6-phosphogluconate dehydrogenase
VKTARCGVIGMAVMGQNLALNMEDHGFPVAVWNRDPSKMREFVARHPDARLMGAVTLQQFVAALERPRVILIMVKAGRPVDLVIESLRPLLDEGDILIDGGNSWFKDTQRRLADLQPAGFRFLGTGVSGGEEGARYGPSLMPGGPAEAYETTRPMFEAIAAKTRFGPCVSLVGPDGAGHFVKMVHNGIEYGVMQVIAEIYDLLRGAGGLAAGEIGEVFADWNRGILESFLVELTARVCTVRDEETGRPLVDLVLDKASQKGTGIWTAQIALEQGVPIPTIAAAIDARVLSSMKAARVRASALFSGPGPAAVEDRAALVRNLHDALLAAQIAAYAQGMALIGSASTSYTWNIDLREVARIWTGGCIIRAKLLETMMEAYGRHRDLPNLLEDEEVRRTMQDAQVGWRRAVVVAQERGIPAPALAASLAYFDSYRTADLPQNLTQAQRDAFGAHTYQRADDPDRGFIHTEWLR